MSKKTSDQAAEIGRIAHRVPGAAAVSGLSESFIWREIKDGRLPAARVGRATLIPDDALRDYIRQHIGIPANPPRAAIEANRRKRQDGVARPDAPIVAPPPAPAGPPLAAIEPRKKRRPQRAGAV